MRRLPYDENPIETRKGLTVESLETRNAPALAAINAFGRVDLLLPAVLQQQTRIGWGLIWNIIGCFQVNETILGTTHAI